MKVTKAVIKAYIQKLMIPILKSQKMLQTINLQKQLESLVL